MLLSWQAPVTPQPVVHTTTATVLAPKTKVSDYNRAQSDEKEQGEDQHERSGSPETSKQTKKAMMDLITSLSTRRRILKDYTKEVTGFKKILMQLNKAADDLDKEFLGNILKKE